MRAAVALYFAWYNFVRPHGSLHGATPAMALGDRADVLTSGAAFAVIHSV